MGENMTTFVDGQVLTAAELNSAFAAPAANLAGGVAGQIPYQTAASTTAFIGAGTAGQILVSQGGTSAPVFESTLSGLTFTGSAFNGTVGATTPSTGAFTTLTASTSVLSPIVGAGSGSNLSLQANATTYATLDTNGNLGLGVTPSAWSGAGSVIQISNSFVRADSNTLGTGNNTYFNGSNYIYQTSGYATLYNQITNQGQHQWYIAPSGTAGSPITFTQAMTLTNAGYLGIGTTSPASILHASVNTTSTTDVITWGNNNGGGQLAVDNNGNPIFTAYGSYSPLRFGHQTSTGTISTFVEQLQLDSSGNLGLGVTPSGSNSNWKQIAAWNASYQGRLLDGSALMAANADLAANNYLTSNYATYYMQTGGSHQWYTAPSGTAGSPITFTQAMTLDNSGNLFVGTTSAPANSRSLGPFITVAQGVIANGFNTHAGVNGAYTSNLFNIQWTGSPYLWIDSTNVGQISLVSDYRVKQKVKTQTLTAIDRIKKLRPVTYEFTNYKDLYVADGKEREGFIAHELQEIIPSAVEGEKDAENQIQSLKLDALCSVMVKAIQEQQEMINQLKAEIAELKGAK